MREFVEKLERAPHYATQPPAGAHVMVMCGLPGAGKDSYISAQFADRPVVSLDALRHRMDVAPTEDQGAVLQAAFEAARVRLRVKRDFLWNATNVTRSNREKIVGLARAYDSSVSTHVVERPLDTLLRQNNGRTASVPDAVIRRLALKFEPPRLPEAVEVVWSERGERFLTMRRRRC
jgi:predicted kinase